MNKAIFLNKRMVGEKNELTYPKGTSSRSRFYPKKQYKPQEDEGRGRNLGFSSKAQVAMEYLLMFSISLIIVGLLWIYASSEIEKTKWELNMNYAKDSVNSITEMADMVYIQGPPAQFYINIRFPENIRNAYLTGNRVTLELLWKNDVLRNITASASVNLTGNLSATSGKHRILIRANNTNVEIRDV